MKINKLTLGSRDYPKPLSQIHKPPKLLYHTGAPLAGLMKWPRVAVVGTRTMSIYGKQTTIKLARELAEQGVVIISGLALGVDCTAHRAALEAGGLCIAVLPSPLENILPVTNRRLAQTILDKGGALVTEYGADDLTFKQYFIARNRIVSGLADAILITEAGEKSGSLYTARFASDQGREVMAIPGNITSRGSVGIHNLIKASKASLVTSLQDILHVMELEGHVTPAPEVKGRNQNEQTVLDLMLQGVSEGEELLSKSRLETSQFNQVITMLEIGDKIRPLGANHWAIT